MLEQARDVMIIISSFFVIAATLLFCILSIIIFRKISTTLAAAQDFFADLKSISSFVTGRIIKPLTVGAVIVAGIQKAFSSFSKRPQKKEEE